MKVNGKNESIQCSIKNCTHHAQDENYCTLTVKECTDCESFVNKA